MKCSVCCEKYSEGVKFDTYRNKLEDTYQEKSHTVCDACWEEMFKRGYCTECEEYHEEVKYNPFLGALICENTHTVCRECWEYFMDIYSEYELGEFESLE